MSGTSFQRVAVGVAVAVLGAAASWAVLGPALTVSTEIAPMNSTTAGPAPSTAPASTAQSAERAPSAEPEAAGYRSAPAVTSYGHADGGPYLTVVRFQKSDAAWPADQTSTFELWFDGDVDAEFESRGFEAPVRFEVKIPERRHIVIGVASPPIDAATYVAFTFKSARPVSLLRSDAKPTTSAESDR